MDDTTPAGARGRRTRGERILQWDIYCRVVDNYGDIGVCWRLASQLAARGERAVLWVDDAAALRWMAPTGCAGVTVHAGAAPARAFAPGDVVIDAFGAGLPAGLVAALARINAAGQRPCIPWINLEYLSAEPHAQASHTLASPVHGGAAAGIYKWFFFPGFTPASGGLLRELDLPQWRAHFRAHEAAAWRAHWGLEPGRSRVISLFCYEPAALAPALLQWAAPAQPPTALLVTHGRAAAALHAALALLPAGWNARSQLQIRFLPPLSQHDYDRLLWCADLNFVRGEDSLVRALWAGAPFVWQAYPQDDGAQAAKIEAMLEVLGAPASWRRYHLWWNGLVPEASAPALEPAAWQGPLDACRARLLAQDDLLTRLQRFVAENR